MKRYAFGMLVVFCIISSIAEAGHIEDLSAILHKRSGVASEDRRHDVYALGVRIGCEGDTLEANVSITGVSGVIEGDTAVMTVIYSGKYYRQGWSVPCQRVSPHLHGLEERNISGKYTFRITGKLFQKPVITWGQASEFGEVTDLKHDSNVFAIRAVQNAIGSAF